jgi:hypothetical protein
MMNGNAYRGWTRPGGRADHLHRSARARLTASSAAWSGQSFQEKGLKKDGSFKAAEVRYTAVDQVDTAKLQIWLAEAREIQWD